MEGPARYTTADVAAAFAQALGRPVEPVIIPQDEWVSSFVALGFSDEAAASYANMTEATLADTLPDPAEVERGMTTLLDYITRLGSLNGRVQDGA